LVSLKFIKEEDHLLDTRCGAKSNLSQNAQLAIVGGESSERPMKKSVVAEGKKKKKNYGPSRGRGLPQRKEEVGRILLTAKGEKMLKSSWGALKN